LNLLRNPQQFLVKVFGQQSGVPAVRLLAEHAATAWKPLPAAALSLISPVLHCMLSMKTAHR
jgi:hypothetical protein